MNKKILYGIIGFIIIIFCMFALERAVYAGEQKLNNLEYNVELNSDGSANVTEIWDIRVEDTNTLFKTFELDNTKYGKITDVKVYEITSNYEKIPFENTGTYAYHVKMGGFYALEYKYGEFEIAWGVSISDAQTKKYEIQYKIEKAIKNYDDCSEFYWQFIGDINAIPANKVTGKITLPKEVTNRENLKVWAHGPLNGNIEIVDNKTVAFEVEKLKPETMVEVRIVSLEDIFTMNTNKITQSKLSHILSEEQKWADQANQTRKHNQMIIILIIIISAVIAIIFIIVIIRYIKKLHSIQVLKPETEYKYFRDFPDENATPAEAAFLYYFNKNSGFENNVSKIVSATILNLALKKVISFEQKEDNKVYIYINENSSETNLKEDEKSIYNMLVDIKKFSQKKNLLKYDEKISMNNIEKYAKKNDTKFLKAIETIETLAKKQEQEKENYNEEEQRIVKKWIDKSATYIAIGLICGFFGMMMLMPIIVEGMTIVLAPFITFIVLSVVSGIICRKIAKKLKHLTQKGTNEKEQWDALKRYMEEFSLLNEKEVPALILWEKYLVYATAFGIADTVLKQLKIKYPELADENYLINNGYTYMYMANRMSIDRMVVSGVQRAYNTGISERASRNYSSRKSEAAEDLAGGGRWWPEAAAGMGGR